MYGDNYQNATTPQELHDLILADFEFEQSRGTAFGYSFVEKAQVAAVRLRRKYNGTNWPDVPTGGNPADYLNWCMAAEKCRRDASPVDGDRAGIEIPDEATLSASSLAEAFGLDSEALRKRLERLRRNDHTCFVENSEREAKEPQFLYRMGKVRAVLEAMKAAGRNVR